jgi:hypothetical protein
MIRVLIADNSPTVQEILLAVLQSDPDIKAETGCLPGDGCRAPDGWRVSGDG